MKNKGLIWVLGGLAVAGIGYFVFTKLKNKAPKKDKNAPIDTGMGVVSLDDIPSTATPPIVASSTPSPNPLTRLFDGLTNLLSNWAEYVVSTQTAPLVVREKPDSIAKKVTTLAKGSTIQAKASGVKGWMAVSQDGENTLGYVSQQYLKLKK